MKKLALNIIYYLILLVAVILILCSLALYCLPYSTSYVQNKLPVLEQKIGDLLHYSLKIGTISIGRDGVNPELQLSNVTVIDPKTGKNVAKIASLYIDINLLKSLINWQFIPKVIILSGAQLELYENTSTTTNYDLTMLYLVPNLFMQNVEIIWHEINGKTIICPDLHIQVKEKLRYRQFAAEGSIISPDNPLFDKLKLRLVANCYGKSKDFALNSKNLTIKGYLALVKPSPLIPQVNIGLWFNWENQKLNSLLSQFYFHNFKYQDLTLDNLQGNVLVQPGTKSSEWAITGNYSNLKVNIGQLFREPLAIDTLQAKIFVQHAVTGWQIWLDNFAMANKDLIAHGRASLLLPSGKESPVVNLLLAATVNNVKRASVYYPAKIMAPALLNWLDSAIVDGESVSGIVLLRGALADFPFIKHNGKFMVDAKINEGTLKLGSDLPTIEHINGKMVFIDAGMEINANGEALHTSLTNFKISIPDFYHPALSATGIIDTKGIESQLKIPISGYLNAGVDYDIFQDKCEFSTDLQGVRIDLPEPLGKTATSQREVKIKASFVAKQPVTISADYANALNLLLTMQKDKQNNTAVSGEIHLGKGMATLQRLPGLVITGNLPTVSWENWQPYFSTINISSSANSNISALFMQIGKFSAYGQVFNNLKLRGSPSKDVWNLQVTSDNAVGTLTIPKDTTVTPIQANFSKLYLTQPAMANTKEELNIQPKDIPPLHIISNDFAFAHKSIGQIELSTYLKNNVLFIDKLLVNSKLFSLTAKGNWQGSLGAEVSSITGNLQINDLGMFLREYAMKNNVVKGKGNISFNLHWADDIFTPDLATLGGDVEVKLQDGSIVNLSREAKAEVGLGRILNLLSLQSLPKRLTLNFGDVTKKGFYFNSITGDFHLATGNAYSNNIMLDGAVAHIKANGRIGLNAVDYDLIMTIAATSFSSSLPGTVIGVATYAAGKVLRHDLQPEMTYTYKVTGPWSNPVIAKKTN